jgi:hypothetical protein
MERFLLKKIIQNEEGSLSFRLTRDEANEEIWISFNPPPSPSETSLSLRVQKMQALGETLKTLMDTMLPSSQVLSGGPGGGKRRGMSPASVLMVHSDSQEDLLFHEGQRGRPGLEEEYDDASLPGDDIHGREQGDPLLGQEGQEEQDWRHMAVQHDQ